jgi:serine/threonine-protein kinase
MAASEPTVIGRYEVVSRLAKGGMASIYLVKDPVVGRLAAIKMVRGESESREARETFAREAQAAQALHHPHIVTVFGIDEHEGLPFIEMEYIEGETLGAIVKRQPAVPIATRIEWIEQLCVGLAYAHGRGVIHHDIKPANLMVDARGRLKILDFGLARRGTPAHARPEVVAGTPNYMSPEQIRGMELDARSDIFAVGAVFYELLAYREAFPGSASQAMDKILHHEPEPVQNLVAGIDPAIGRIVARAIAKDRDARYQDLPAMTNDLRAVRVRVEDGDAVDMLRGAREEAPNLPARRSKMDSTSQ